jgi:hypothetical protein
VTVLSGTTGPEALTIEDWNDGIAAGIGRTFDEVMERPRGDGEAITRMDWKVEIGRRRVFFV